MGKFTTAVGKLAIAVSQCGKLIKKTLWPAKVLGTDQLRAEVDEKYVVTVSFSLQLM